MIEKELEMARHPISITLPEECIKWLDKKVRERIFHNRSHAIEVLILEAMKKEKESS